MPLYSYSRISTYETCPYQYKLHYIDNIKTEKEGIEAFMGSRVHETLEKLYADLILSKMNSLEELIALYNEQWEKEWHDDVLIVKKDMTKEDYRKAGEKAIKEYYAHYHPFDQAKTLWTEKIVHFDLGDEKYRFQGVVDRLDRTKDGVYEIHDYKSSGRLPSQSKLDKDRQLALYQLAVKEAFPKDPDVELVWHYVLFDTEMRSTRNQEQLEEIVTEFMALIDEIEGAKEFPTKESALCNWCGYWEHCPRKRHMLQLEDYSEDEKKTEEGHVLVDKYADLKDQEKLIKRELEEVQESLLEYSKDHDVEVILGTKKKVKISRKTEIGLPSKSADEGTYEKISQLVIDSGLWDQMSTLNIRKLVKDLNDGALPKTLSKKLEKFTVEEMKERLTLSNLDEEEEGGS